VRRLTSIVAIVVSLASISQCLAADDKKPTSQLIGTAPVAASTARPKIASDAVENQLLKYDASGAPIGSAVYEKDGKLGVGTPDPLTVLHVKADVNSSSVLRVTNINAGTSAYAALQFGINGVDLAGAVFQNSTNNTAYGGPGSVNIGSVASYPVSIVAGNASKLIVLPNGNVGVGTTAPQTRFDVKGTAGTLGAGARQVMRLFDDTAMAAGVGSGIDFSGKYDTGGNYTQFANIKGVKANAISGEIDGKFVVSVIDSAGNFNEIATVTPTGLAVTGNISATGSITGATVVGAVYQDVAEWVETGEKLAAGTVVVVARDHTNQVIASARPYDTRVAGVVSEKPGVILGVAGDSKAMVATTGRVRVHVDATASPIEIGDLLVSSTKPGSAMKSIPVDVNGIEMHRPGTLIGKALEALPSGQGDILVLLSLQ